MSSRSAIFLDRDDTLIRCDDVTPDGDLGDPTLVELLPGVKESCAALKEAGYLLVVVTNQGGVARGRYTEEDVRRVMARLNELLDGLIDDCRYCPYHPQGTVAEYGKEHPWRKPAPGMLLDVAMKRELDLSRCWMIGDKVRDCEAGRAAGCRTILVGRPAAAGQRAVGMTEQPAVDFVARDLPEASAIVLREHRA